MPREDLRLLVKQERNLRSLMDNIQDFANGYQAERDFISLKFRMQKLDELYDKFIRVRENIEVLTDDAEMDVCIQGDEEQAALERAMRISEREEVNMRIIKDFENRFFDIKHCLGVLEAAESGSGASTQRSIQASVSQPRIKLPELKLPTFSGRLQDWITFRDTFSSMIHNNHNLSDIDKFTYLRTSLTGDALAEIGSIELTSANYSIAWQALHNSFENKKLLVKSYLDVLFSVYPMEEESYEQLHRVVKDFETTLMMLQKVGVETDGMTTILQHMLCQRLDSATLHHWECHHNSKEVPTYPQLIEFLKSRCMVLRHIARFCVKGSCQICGRGHHTLLHAGPVVSQSNLEQLRVPQHVNQDANQQPPQNQTEIPFEEILPNSTLQNQTHLSHNPNMINYPSFSTTDNPSTSHSAFISVNPSNFSSTVLLSTAVVMIEDGYGNSIPARALLDSGSQLCFMTERISQSLKLRRYRHHLPVNGIGQSTTCSTQSVIASIGSRYTNYRSTLKFHVLPKVTSGLPEKKFNITSWKIPPGLNIADHDFQNPGNIDLILGAEIFYDLLLEGQHKLNDVGPVLQNTKLGWIVSGKVFNENQVQNLAIQHDVMLTNNHMLLIWSNNPEPPEKAD
ncbi:uncharacterized protein LOC129753751 [Uranotaenia lowii]|uniref:uncharacterized protein LOC129753751 n=1 Tax=Uranotaenia lowii TaxID=190385 RepID=UPI002479246B|nr:uncharacterized protein LOC129753751 [Uranotaenia lowii]